MSIIFRLHLIFYSTVLGLVALTCLIMFSFSNYKTSKAMGQQLDDIQFNVLTASSMRDSYFLYRNVRAQKQWELRFSNSITQINESLKSFAGLPEEEELIYLKRELIHINSIFNRVIANSEHLNPLEKKEKVYEELDKRLISQILIRSSVLLDKFEALQSLRQIEEKRAYNTLLLSFFISCCILFIMLIPNLYSLTHLIRRHVFNLNDGLKIIAGGNLEFILKDKGNDELAEISRTINSITRKLSTTNFLLTEAQSIAKIGSWKIDLQSNEETWTQEHYNIFEINDVVPKNLLLKKHIEYIHPEDQNSFNECLENAKNSSADFISDHRIILGDNKKVKHLQIIGKVTKDENGIPLFVSGTCRDFTAEFDLESSLQLERLKSIQNSKLASLGEMSAGIAHEINNPLAIIVGNIHLLPRYMNDSEKFLLKIETIAKATHRIEKIVSGLKKFSRSSENDERRPELLSNLIKEAIIIIGPKSQSHYVKVDLDILHDAEINCDVVEIEQVIINLISNSIDAVAHQDKPWIKVTSVFDFDEVVIRVIDSGIGISDEVEQKIFLPFFTTKDIGSGTGLGLSISKGILDKHNASITLNRNFPNTCFEIRFKIWNEIKLVA